MRWELYLQQTRAMSVITVAVFVLVFGLFALWYLIQVSQVPVIQRYRSCMLLAFWTFLTSLYLSFLTWLFFFLPS